ncbi:DUF5701 family protein [Nocardioides sediminis]|uniref:DUF5701 family protein n=1 Tax=Nocardioides sediminis TaxID=433648 RepID=UPI000D2FBC8B|nr:DUF5701 family protein [Nocardioides sediminis]
MTDLTDLSSKRHEQVRRLVAAGVAAAAGVTPARVEEWAAALPDVPGTVLALHHDVVPAAVLATCLVRGGRPGFVVEDMTDLHEFVPQVVLPESPLYLVEGVHRGDEMLNWSPEEAQASLDRSGRLPLTIHEGISWILQEPDRLDPGACFMTIASRRPRTAGGFDARTPALWISGGTGRDGKERRGAPKVGWCWWRNRHTWLGFASATRRIGADLLQPPASADPV